jgi:2-polyprenyl-3-methyl-5-hydroxy-6-metoxy-1,4-benzoquinol methylase
LTTDVPAPYPRLVCPEHGIAFDSSAAGTELRCFNGHAYAVRDAIPRIVPAADSYAEAFGAQWKQYRTTQLDSRTGTSYSRDRLCRCVGEEIWERLNHPEPLNVLEAGCGAGRFTEILLSLPAPIVTSTDLSSAVEPNQVNFPQSPRHRVVQADINRLPFEPAQYDLVLCLGVVQHTKDPEQTIASLYRQVRPGGWLVIDHYTHSLSMYTKVTAAILRPVLKRLPPAQGIRATKALTRWFFPLHRAVRNHRYLQYLLSRVSPLLTYYHALPMLDDRQQYEWAELDTHDSLTDWYKRLRSAASIRRTLVALRAERIWVEKGGNGVEARCRKPAGST